MGGDALTRADLQAMMSKLVDEALPPVPLAIYADSRYPASYAIHGLAAVMWNVPLIDTAPPPE